MKMMLAACAAASGATLLAGVGAGLIRRPRPFQPRPGLARRRGAGCRAGGRVRCRGVGADGDRLVAVDAGFHQATVIAVGRFLAVVVAEVDFDARDLFGESVDGGVDDGLYVGVEAGVAFDGFVAVDIDLHMLTPGYTKRNPSNPGSKQSLRGRRAITSGGGRVHPSRVG